MLGFTRKEAVVVLFLIITLLLGIGIRYYKMHWKPFPEISDTAFKEERISGGDYGIEEAGVVENDTIVIRISLNTAEIEDLVSLPGVGVSIATRIVEYRRQHGEFLSVDELLKVKGIGPKTQEKIKPYLKLNE